MRSLTRNTTVLGIVLLLWQGAEGKVRIVTTTPDLAAIAEAVGGGRVEVRSIAKGYQDPHYVAAKPSYMRTLNRADLLVYTGLELEVGWLPLLIRGARNPKVVLGAAGHLDASEGIRVLEVPSGHVDRSMGDVHPEGNPHYMLDPRNGLVVAEAIRARLEDLAPEDREALVGNSERFKRNLEGRIREWEARADGLSGRKVVTYHKQWEYLTHWLGLEIADQVEDKPGIPPSPRHIANLVRRMKSEGIRIVICSNTVDPKPAEQVAERAGAQLLILPMSVGGEPGIETYADLFDTIVSQIASAFSGS
jgi:zinc/manganese transport system substrate-binding protein